ncbi:MAG: NAD-dependent epimerase/dehydratase family protein [Helicobacteraceae bacterium]|jgi:NADH dehydrogenase|nr:NAD-dependent epimerase/dehydratase family protein [Helicobacteraceae bacterium]
MLILIAGGGGYVGRGITQRFCAEHDFINVSKTRGSEFAVNNALVDLERSLNFLRFDRPIDMIINCVECHPDNFESGERMKRAYVASARHLIEYAEDFGVKKFIHFSVNHINTVENDYQQAKFVVEGLVKSSGLQYIIFKPTIIFGENSPLDYLIDSLLAKTALFKFWKDDARIAPIHIFDVVSNVGYALKNDECWNNTYALYGPDMMGFEEILTRRARFGRPRFLSVPMAMARRSFLNLKNAGSPPRHLRLLLDWVNTDDRLNRSREPLVEPQFSYKRRGYGYGL